MRVLLHNHTERAAVIAARTPEARRVFLTRSPEGIGAPATRSNASSLRIETQIPLCFIPVPSTSCLVSQSPGCLNQNSLSGHLAASVVQEHRVFIVECRPTSSWAVNHLATELCRSKCPDYIPAARAHTSRSQR